MKLLSNLNEKDFLKIVHQALNAYIESEGNITFSTSNNDYDISSVNDLTADHVLLELQRRIDIPDQRSHFSKTIVIVNEDLCVDHTIPSSMLVTIDFTSLEDGTCPFCHESVLEEVSERFDREKGVCVSCGMRMDATDDEIYRYKFGMEIPPYLHVDPDTHRIMISQYFEGQNIKWELFNHGWKVFLGDEILLETFYPNYPGEDEFKYVVSILELRKEEVLQKEKRDDAEG